MHNDFEFRHPSWPADVQLLSLTRDRDTYLFLFNADNRSETLRQLGRLAANPELNFSWYDAAVLSLEVRKHQPPRRLPL